MTHRSEITQSNLKRLLHYDSETGIFTRLVRTCNRVHVGDIAGSINCRGYLIVRLNNRNYLTHRLAFLYMTGKFPKEVDHINHVRTDNRWVNLRPANRLINTRNISLAKNNSSGISGVCWHTQIDKWRVYISIDRRQLYLGCYEGLFDAACARKSAEKKHGFHANHGGI